MAYNKGATFVTSRYQVDGETLDIQEALNETIEDVNNRPLQIKTVHGLMEVDTTSFSGGEGVILTDSYRGGNFVWVDGNQSSRVFVKSVTGTVGGGGKTVNSPNHGLKKGCGVTVSSSGSGLSATSVYWVSVDDTDSFGLSSTYADSLSGVTISISSSSITVKEMVDPARGVYVPSSADPVAETGVFVRQASTLMLDYFGAIGDGVSDDTASLVSSCKFMNETGITDIHWSENRTYTTINPWWPVNTRVLRVHGNGSKIKNIATFPRDRFNMQSATGCSNTTTYGTYTPVQRFLIDDATKGQNSVTCSNPSEAGNLSTGEFVMVACHDQQFGGQPPGYRFFDFMEVESVNNSTGVVTFTTKLTNNYYADYPYKIVANSDGRAHIEKIEEGSLWNIHHEYNDIEFVRHDSLSKGYTYCIGKDVTFRRCVSDNFVPTVSSSVRLIDCIQSMDGELDKLVKTFYSRGSVFEGELTSGTAVTLAHFENSTLHNYKLAPNELKFTNCSVTADSADNTKILDSYGRCEKIVISGGSHQYLPSYSTATSQVSSISLSSSSATWDDANSVLTLDISATSDADFAGRLSEGVRVDVTNSVSGSEVSAGIFGLVEVVTGGENVAQITIPFNESISGTETLTVFPEPDLTIIDGKESHAVIRESYVLSDKILTSGFSELNIPTKGSLKRLLVSVDRPYTGTTTGDVKLTISNRSPNFESYKYSVDLRTTGVRETTLFGHYGFSGLNGESSGSSITLASAYSDRFFGTLNVTATSMDSTNASELPIVNVVVELGGG